MARCFQDAFSDNTVGQVDRISYPEQEMLFSRATPAFDSAIVSQLNREIVRVLRTADVKGKLLNAGLEVVAGSPEAFSAVIKSDMDRMGKVIKEAGIKAD